MNYYYFILIRNVITIYNFYYKYCYINYLALFFVFCLSVKFVFKKVRKELIASVPKSIIPTP
jgi:hypothetical protein